MLFSFLIENNILLSLMVHLFNIENVIPQALEERIIACGTELHFQ